MLEEIFEAAHELGYTAELESRDVGTGYRYLITIWDYHYNRVNRLSASKLDLLLERAWTWLSGELDRRRALMASQRVP